MTVVAEQMGMNRNALYKLLHDAVCTQMLSGREKSHRV